MRAPICLAFLLALFAGYLLYRDSSRKPKSLCPNCGPKCKAPMHGALVATGFTECSFDPTPGSLCQKCGSDHKQLYIRHKSERDCEFWCCDCVLEEYIKMRAVR